MHKKFEINLTKIKGSCQVGRKVVIHKWFASNTFLFFIGDLARHLLSGPVGQKPTKTTMSLPELKNMITGYDLARLKSFTNNMVEYRLIVDLVPTLAKLYFLFKAGGLENLKLSPIQKGILIGNAKNNNFFCKILSNFDNNTSV